MEFINTFVVIRYLPFIFVMNTFFCNHTALISYFAFVVYSGCTLTSTHFELFGLHHFLITAESLFTSAFFLSSY